MTQSQAGEEQNGIKAKPYPEDQNSGSDSVAVCHIESQCLKPRSPSQVTAGVPRQSAGIFSLLFSNLLINGS